MICASEVLPSPGGPASSTWSSASPRAFAASSAIESCSLTRSCATKSASVRGRSERLELLLGVGEHGREELRAHAACLSAWRTCSSSGRLASTSASARSASISDQPSSTSASRAVRSPPLVADRAERQLLLQLEHDALRGLQADAGDRLEALDVVARDRAAQLGRRRAGDDRERDLRADAVHAEQQLEELALVGRGEAEELQRVLADDGVDLDHDLAVAEPAHATAWR